jgi:hypothetical protein
VEKREEERKVRQGKERERKKGMKLVAEGWDLKTEKASCRGTQICTH